MYIVPNPKWWEKRLSTAKPEELLTSQGVNADPAVELNIVAQQMLPAQWLVLEAPARGRREPSTCHAHARSVAEVVDINRSEPSPPFSFHLGLQPRPVFGSLQPQQVASPWAQTSFLWAEPTRRVIWCLWRSPTNFLYISMDGWRINFWMACHPARWGIITEDWGGGWGWAREPTYMEHFLLHMDVMLSVFMDNIFYVPHCLINDDWT